MQLIYSSGALEAGYQSYFIELPPLKKYSPFGNIGKLGLTMQCNRSDHTNPEALLHKFEGGSNAVSSENGFNTRSTR